MRGFGGGEGAHPLALNKGKEIHRRTPCHQPSDRLGREALVVGMDAPERRHSAGTGRVLLRSSVLQAKGWGGKSPENFKRILIVFK